MAAPASLFRPNDQPEPLVATGQLVPSPHGAHAEPVSAGREKPSVAEGSGLIVPSSAGAVEFDTVVPPSRQIAVLAPVQWAKVRANFAGQVAHVWADQHSVHVLVDCMLIRTVPPNLGTDELHELRMRSASPARPPPAAASPARMEFLPGGTVVEVDRVDENGRIGLDKFALKVGVELARRKITVRLDGHLTHIVSDGALAETLPSPVPAEDHRKLRTARLASTPLPPPAPGPIIVQRKVPVDGVVMVARQSLRVGRAYAGRIVTIDVEDAYFWVSCDGAELSLHPRTSDHPVRRWKAKINAPKL